MTLRVHITPSPDTIADDNGIGRVIHAQYRYLPALGIELVGDPAQAEVIACHIAGDGLPRVDVQHLHGIYWTGDAGGRYELWHHEANRRIIETARRARAITVPSAWVGEVFKRDMRRVPEVIGHGIEAADWKPATHTGYVLWNKSRTSDVCDVTPAVQLAATGLEVVSTFGPEGLAPTTMRIDGPQPHARMRELVRHAEIYLATTKETFGIGTLEALSAGVPVLGYAWGGTRELVEHQITGYLAKPGDLDDLFAGYDWIREHRAELCTAARERAKAHTWQRVMRQYADLYYRMADARATEPTGVSVVIVNYNYGAYVEEAIASVLAQTLRVDEVIVVDDGSTDDSLAVLGRHAMDPRIHVIKQANLGVASARNRGIQQARQPYIVCLDADDRLDPRYVETLHAALTADPALGVAYTGLGLLNADGDVMPSAWPPAFDWTVQTTPATPPSNCIPCAAMFRRAMWERAGGYKQVYAPAEDTEFFTRGLSIGFLARQVTPDALFHYRVHAGSASRTKQYRPIDLWHPWMRDKQYPLAAPADTVPLVRSYSEPAVSVVIPVGPGHARYLPAALDSLLGQTCRSWEVIVVDDSGETLPLTPYPFARVRHLGTAHGPAAARNAGLARARAPLVVFLDADDYLLPAALDRMLRQFLASNGKYVYSDWIAVNGETSTQDEAPEYRPEAWLERGQHAVTALLPAAWAREVGGFDETMHGWEDWDFYVKLAIRGMCGVRVPEPLLAYRQHTGTVRAASLARKDELLAVLRERYAAYATGEQPMPACCGGNADALLAAQQAIAQANAEVGGVPVRALALTQPSMPTATRMEFTGEQIGAITYFGKDGRPYRGGNNPMEKYVDVHYPEDVTILERTGRWRVVRA